MKVVFLVSNLMSGGVERTVTYVSEYFSKNNIDTTILSISDEVFYDVDPDVKLVRLHIPRDYSTINERLIRAILRYTKVNHILHKNKYDVIFCMSPDMIRYVSYSITHGHHGALLVSSERNNPLYDNKREKRIKRKAFPRCDGIIFQTERARECFPESVRNKGVIIPNAVGNPLAYSVTAKKNKKK